MLRFDKDLHIPNKEEIRERSRGAQTALGNVQQRVKALIQNEKDLISFESAKEKLISIVEKAVKTREREISEELEKVKNILLEEMYSYRCLDCLGHEKIERIWKSIMNKK